MNSYTQTFIQAIEKNPKKFETLLKLIVESPFQTESGDAYVTRDFARDVCSELYYMASDGEMSVYDSLEVSANNEKQELLQITF